MDPDLKFVFVIDFEGSLMNSSAYFQLKCHKKYDSRNFITLKG